MTQHPTPPKPENRFCLITAIAFCIFAIAQDETPIASGILSCLIAPISLGLGWIATDIWHYLCHKLDFLYKIFHQLHHVAFKREWNTKPEALAASRLSHEIPEALIMLSVCLILLILLYIFQTPGWMGAIYGLIHALNGLYNALRIFLFQDIEHFLRSDLNHQQYIYENPPGTYLVNSTYHYRHHYDSQTAYFAGKIALLDFVFKTSLDLKNRRICILEADHV